MATGLHLIETLSEREMAVLRLMAQGKTNPEIAEELGIRFETAKWYVSEVLQKLQVPSREAAAAEYRRYNRPAARLHRAFAAVPLFLRWGAAATAVLATAAVLIALNVPEPRNTQAEAQWLVAYVEDGQPGIEPELAPIRIVDVQSGERWDFGESDTWGGVAWSPSGDRVLGLRRSWELVLLSYPDGDTIDFDAPEPQRSLRLSESSWSPDGRRFYVAGSMFDKNGDQLWTTDPQVQFAMWAPNGVHVALARENHLAIVLAVDGTIVFEGEAVPSIWLSPTQLGALSVNPGLSFDERARIVDLSKSPPDMTTPEPSFDTDRLLTGQIPGLDSDAARSLLESKAAGEPVSIVLGGASTGTAVTVVGELAERLGAPPNPAGILVTDGQEAFRVDVEPRWTIPGIQGEWGYRLSFVILD